MRNELNQIETIERFLLDEMSAEEKIHFEQALIKDLQLQENVELQKQITQRIQVNAFRDEALKFHHSYEIAQSGKSGLKFFLNTILWIVVAGGLAVVGYSLIPKKTEKPSTSVINGNKELTTNALPALLTSTPPPASLEKKVLPFVKKTHPVQPLPTAPLPKKPYDQTPADFSHLKPHSHSYFLDATTGGTIVLQQSKSVVNIPGRALMDANGKEVTGRVEIKCTEYRNAAEMALVANINNEPLTTLYSAGLFDIKAYQDSRELQLQPQQSFTIDYVLAKKMDSLALFALDDKTGHWEKIQFISYGSPLEKDIVNRSAPEPNKADENKYRTQLLVRITGLEDDLLVNDVKVNFSKETQPIVYKQQLLDSGYYALEISHYRGNISITCPGYKKITLNNLTLKNNKAMVVQGKFARKHPVYHPHAWFSKGKSTATIVCDDMDMVELNDLKPNKKKGKKENGLLVMDGKKLNQPRNTVLDAQQPNLVQGLVCSKFGVYSIQQTHRLPNRTTVNARYFDEKGTPIAHAKMVSLIDLNYNGAFTGSPEKFECSKTGRNILLLFTNDNQIYACTEESMKKINFEHHTQEFNMTNITSQIKSSQDLKKYLGI